MKNKRETSIELLRIILAIGIVIFHINQKVNGGGLLFVEEKSFKFYFITFIQCVFSPSVDIFIIVSGYFLSTENKRKLSKVFELIVQVVVFNICFYVASLFVGDYNVFSIRELIRSLFLGKYFVVFYCVLYIISPYINIFLERLNKQQSKCLLFILILIFSCYSYLIDILESLSISQDLSSISIKGSQEGYTIVNFILLYFIGAYIRKYDTDIKTLKTMILLIISLTSIFIISITPFINTTALNYNSPFVISFAMLVFKIFKRLKIKNKFINQFSKATLTCYLFHQPFVCYLINITEKVMKSNIVNIIVYEVTLGICFFVISFVIYKVYYEVFQNIIKRKLSKFDNVDIYKLNDIDN